MNLPSRVPLFSNPGVKKRESSAWAERDGTERAGIGTQTCWGTAHGGHKGGDLHGQVVKSPVLGLLLETHFPRSEKANY